MKMKFTALLLTSIICMAGAVSCGKVENTDTSSTAELKISTTTAAATAEGETTTTEAVTTTGEGETTTTAAGYAATTAAETQAAAADATTAAQQEATAAPTEAPTEATTEAPAQQQEQQQQNNETPATQSVQFSTDLLLQNAADTIAALGGSPTTSVSPSCTNNGCDVKTYTYPDMEIQCYIDGGVEYIYSVTIKGGDHATSKGIKVGSSRADVEAAYGAGIESGNMIVYADGNKEMDITYNGDTVATIDFYTPV